MKPTRLLVLRQGGTQWHTREQLVGQKNIELSLDGLERAERAAQFLEPDKIEVIYASNLGRAMDTAKVIAKYHRLRVIPAADLNERGFGVLEGKGRKEIAKELRRLVQPEALSEGAETGFHFERRVIGFLEDCLLENAGKNVLMVSHEGPIRVIQRYFTRFDETKGDDDYVASLAGLSEFVVRSLEPLEVAIKKWDETKHLK